MRSRGFQSRVRSTSIIYGNINLFFLILILIHYFLRTPFGPREWLAVCELVYLVYLFFSYLSHALLDLSKTGTTFYLMHTLQATAIFRIILSLNIIPEHTLHSRVKDSITHNSTVI